MLLLMLQTEDCRYVIDAGKITEIIPLVNYVKVPNGPEFLAGIINYRGKPVPVVDLGLLLKNRACRLRMNSRIILFRVKRAGGSSSLIGVIGENITGTLRLNCSKEKLNERLVHELLNKDDKGKEHHFVKLLEPDILLDEGEIASIHQYI
jgi:chemotaxis signal transduction protein